MAKSMSKLDRNRRSAARNGDFHEYIVDPRRETAKCIRKLERNRRSAESLKNTGSHTKISRQGCSIRPTVCVTEQDARLRASKQRNASKATRSTPLLLQTAPNAFGSRLRDLRPGLRIANNFVAKCTANESAAQRCQRPSPRARTTSRRCKTQK